MYDADVWPWWWRAITLAMIMLIADDEAVGANVVFRLKTAGDDEVDIDDDACRQ